MIILAFACINILKEFALKVFAKIKNVSICIRKHAKMMMNTDSIKENLVSLIQRLDPINFVAFGGGRWAR